MEENKVKVRIKPLHGIGGVGEASDVVLMSKADAEMYFKDGYVEYVEESEQPELISSETANAAEVEDHAIMKPQAKRGKKS